MKNFILISLLLIFVQSCRTQKDVLYFQNINEVIDNELPDNFTEPTIQVGDELSIMVIKAIDQKLAQKFNLPSAKGGSGMTNNYYIVNNQGNIEMPILGQVHVEGKTRENLAREIKKEIEQNYINDILVNVRINNYKVVMLGEFGSPGIKTFTTDKVNIIDAIASAGNMNFSAIRDSVLVIRNVDGIRTKGYLNLLNAESMNSPYFYLKQNDIVYAMPTKSRAMSFNNLPMNVALSVIGFALTIIAIFK